MEILRKKVNGLLLVGDPHVTTTKPGRRTDEDFLATAIDKLAQAGEIARARGLLPVSLGDFFHKPDEVKPYRMLVSVARAVQGGEQWHEILGNTHTSNEQQSNGAMKVTEQTALGLCKEWGLLRVIDRSGPWAVLEIEGKKIGLGATPYGLPIPTDVRSAFGEEPVEKVIWFTHHDIAFENAYPGSAPAHEILGCDLVVNGHMHDTKPNIVCGGTTWANPGNILRLSVDMIDHRPSVWEWKPSTGMQRHELRFQRDRFDLTGIRVQADGSEMREMSRDSVFAQMLKRERGSDMERSESGDVIIEDIREVLLDRKSSPEAAAIVEALHRRAAVGVAPGK
jgi:hypothetical protein